MVGPAIRLKMHLLNILLLLLYMHPIRFVELKGGLGKWNNLEEALDEAYLRMSENRQTCSIDKDYKDIMLSFSKVHKRKMQDNDRISARTEKTIQTASVFRIGYSMGCLCGAEPHLLDLGLLYFPRYVPTAVCRQRGCQAPLRCRQRTYKVSVLRKRGSDSHIDADFITTATVPDSLKDSWTSETVTVTVACECIN